MARRIEDFKDDSIDPGLQVLIDDLPSLAFWDTSTSGAVENAWSGNRMLYNEQGPGQDEKGGDFLICSQNRTALESLNFSLRKSMDQRAMIVRI